MAAATKNAKKIYMNGTKRVVFIVLQVLFVGLVGYAVYAKNVTDADKNNVIEMRNKISMLVDRIESSDRKIILTDSSSCFIFRPNVIGEKVKYSCNTLHAHRQTIANQQEVDDLVRIVTEVLHRSTDIVQEVKDFSTNSVNIDGDVKQNSYYNATSFELKNIHMNQGTCYARYVIADTKNSIEVILECVVDTKQPYFEPIKEV